VRILGFDWDETNRRKLELHDLEPEDVEDLFASGDPFVFAHPKQRGRYLALGFAGERFVLAVFEVEVTTRWARVITAYEPTNPGWWRRYAKAKGL
jgi:uncharacterized DUF497 family protein